MNLKLSGEKVRAARRRAKLTQVALSKKSRISQSFLSRMEQGDRGARPRTVERLARALRVAPETLLAEKLGAYSPFRKSRK
jgi:transcriptional regulator with XRE-family HTH domain